MLSRLCCFRGCVTICGRKVYVTAMRAKNLQFIQYSLAYSFTQCRVCVRVCMCLTCVWRVSVWVHACVECAYILSANFWRPTACQLWTSTLLLLLLGRCLHCFKAKWHYSWAHPYASLMEHPTRHDSQPIPLAPFDAKWEACLLLCMTPVYTSICAELCVCVRECV